MKLFNFLFETPELIEPIGGNFSIENPKRNKSLYDDIMYHHHKEIQKISDEIKIVYCTRQDEDYKFQYVGLDIEHKHVAFISRIDIDTDKILGKYAFQTLVWVDNDYKPLFYKWPKKIIFDILLPKYGVVTSDATHTPLGMKYWSNLVKYAIDKNLNVYFYNKSKKIVVKILSVHHLYDLQTQYKIWEKSENGQNKILVITKKELQETHTLEK
jgi:hypothetical protein